MLGSSSLFCIPLFSECQVRMRYSKQAAPEATALLSSQIPEFFPTQGSGLTLPSHRLPSAAQGG